MVIVERYNSHRNNNRMVATHACIHAFYASCYFSMHSCDWWIGTKITNSFLALAVFISESSTLLFREAFGYQKYQDLPLWRRVEEIDRERRDLFIEKIFIPSYVYLLLWAGFFLSLKTNKLFSTLFLTAVLLSYAYTFRCIKRGIKDRDDLIFAALILLLNIRNAAR